MIALNQIRIDGGTQSRIELNQDVVAEYAEAYKTGVQMPPVVVFFDGTSFWLADGFHRFFGAKHAGLLEIHEDRHPGTQRDAVLYSLGANAKHGLRRSNADKRKAVQTLLDDSEWAAWSSREVARQCGVSHTFVDSIREPHLATLPDSTEKAVTNNVRDVTVSRNGTTYQQNTANIGTRPSHRPEISSANLQSTVTQPQAAKLLQVSPRSVATAAKVERTAPAEAAPTVQSELEELKDFCTEQGQNLKATLEENESMARVFESDDKIVAAMAEVKRFSEMNRVLTERNNGLRNELAESVRLLKGWKRRAEKAEAALKEAINAA